MQETETGEEFAQKLATDAVSPEFKKAFNEHMAKYGCRTIREIDIATPRPYENISEFFNILKAIDIHNNRFAEISRRRSEAYEQLLALATQKGKEKQFKKLAAVLENIGYREKPKYFFAITVDLMRRRALEIGGNLVEEGRLDEPEQVFDLTVDQLTQAQKDPSLDLRFLIARNLASRAKQVHVREWPRVIDSRGKIYHVPRTALKDGELVGDAVSSGVVKGIARVLHMPYEKTLKKGEILVTRATEPAWIPIFMNAAGVVLEVGGPLQHGAVVARELGLPCVTGINAATQSIPDGALIEVDGNNGIVRLLEESKTIKGNATS